MRKKIGDTIGKRKLYCFAYSDEGQGKTTLTMTASKDWGKLDLPRSKRGLDIAFVTPEDRGPTAVRSKDIDGVGFSDDIPMEVLSDQDWESMFADAISGVRAFGAMKDISTICVDGLSVMCNRFIRLYTDGGTDKDMGWDGWGTLYGKLRELEGECEAVYRKGKSIIYTAWTEPPKFEETQGGQSLKEIGRPFIPGKGKRWMPGNCDIVARLQSHFKKVPAPGGKGTINKWHGTLQVHATTEYLAKTRWSLPNPAPANWGEILKLVAGQQ
jgi:hypothetical protein